MVRVVSGGPARKRPVRAAAASAAISIGRAAIENGDGEDAEYDAPDGEDDDGGDEVRSAAAVVSPCGGARPMGRRPQGDLARWPQGDLARWRSS